MSGNFTDHERRLILSIAEREGMEPQTLIRKFVVDSIREHIEALQNKIANRINDRPT